MHTNSRVSPTGFLESDLDAKLKIDVHQNLDLVKLHLVNTTI